MTRCKIGEPPVFIPTSDGLDSRSLVPLMRGNFDGWNNETVSHFSDGGHDAVKDNNYVNNLMIKQDDLKYQFYQNMPEVLFDLKRNPDETINYIDDPAYTADLEKFRARLAQLGYGENAV